MINRIVLIFFIFIVKISNAQQTIPLYSGKIPNSKISINEEQITANALVDTVTRNVSIPTLTIFLPLKNLSKGSAVIICPGGGYGGLLTKREGSDVARAFAKLGVTAFMLKYRLPNDAIMEDKSIGPLQDALQALKMVHQNALKWNIDASKIGIMGFSAGGHLASSAGTYFDAQVIENSANIDLRPSFMVLINPVISFSNEIGHIGSRNNLLGKPASAEKIQFFSNELHVNQSTPQTFLVHTADDTVVSPENSFRFYHALRKNKVNSELHIYSEGEHGFLKKPVFEEWFGRVVNWMKDRNLIELGSWNKE
ncbi:alpha/beta hydrolase [Daejeonella sp.]|uniref:alpha/beta hydrolase n=1 Tax=Daejeonella sp. TaxID=2805397 RepID=UPI0027BB1090|nr:alpha/beta hydrolase [Daejeonella sp.]